MSQPVFILFKPQLGENIGAVARAMSNFGLTDLRIVDPRDGWPNPAAEAMAAHGDYIIEQAQLFDTLAEALHDITRLYATTARTRAMDKPVYTPNELFTSPLAGGQSVTIDRSCGSSPLNPPASGGTFKCAILFGPERSGLSNEEIVLADAVVTIPVSEENPSLNLAQSAVVIAYEWFTQTIPSPSGGGLGWWPKSAHPSLDALLLASPLRGEESQMATKQELDGFFDHLKPLLDDVNYFREPSREESMWLTLRHIFTRTNLTSQEVQTLRGVVRAISKSCGLPKQ